MNNVSLDPAETVSEFNGVIPGNCQELALSNVALWHCGIVTEYAR